METDMMDMDPPSLSHCNNVADLVHENFREGQL